jgi:hypothetical protein
VFRPVLHEDIDRFRSWRPLIANSSATQASRYRRRGGHQLTHFHDYKLEAQTQKHNSKRTECASELLHGCGIPRGQELGAVHAEFFTEFNVHVFRVTGNSRQHLMCGERFKFRRKEFL